MNSGDIYIADPFIMGVTLRNLALVRSNASALGGSIFVSSGQLMLFNTSISSSSADNGGCIAISRSAVVRFAGVQLEGCKASAAGGGLFIDGAGTVTPFRHSSPSDGMTIVRCDASTGGGAFLAYNARADGLVIRDCTAEHGGGVALMGSQVILSSAVVSSCTARATGGCLHAYSATSATVDGQFRNCSAVQSGGVASVLGSSIVAGGALTFSLGTARVTGGGVWASGVSSLSGVAISNCAARGGGGISAEPGAALALRGVNITGCSAYDGGGGGLAVQSDAYVTMTDAHVEGCRAPFGAGINANARAVLTGLHTLVAGCTAAYGGGIACHGCEIHGMNVEACSASVWGGGVAVSGTNVVLDSVHIEFCNAGSAAGGLYLAEAEASFFEVDVASCFAPTGAGVSVNASQLTRAVGAAFSVRASGNGNSSTHCGGNLYISGTRASIAGAILTNGTAVHGGCVAIFDAPGAAISTSMISGGVASGNGGGAEVNNSPGVVFVSSSIQHCQALNAGGLWLNNSDVALPNTNVSQNFASEFGGGVVLNQHCSIVGPNALIASNTATISGGGIAVLIDGTISDGVLVRACTAMMHGGCIYLATAAVANFNGVGAVGCSATSNGGAAFVSEVAHLMAVRFYFARIFEP